MDYQKLNKLLVNLNNIRNSYYTKQMGITKEEYPNIEEDAEGYYEIYKLGDDFPEMYLRIRITTDSYGDNEQITGIKFVKPTTKTITTFE